MKNKQLQKNWQIKEVSKFAEVITGGTPSTAKKEYWENGTIPWLPSGKCQNCEIISAEKFITEEGLKNSAARMMPKKTVVMALTGTTTGKIGILKIEASANQSVTGILPSEEHLPKFLFYYLKTIRKKILSQSYGGAQPHISQGFVKKLKIPLPPLQTQKKIVQILEQAEQLKQKRKQADRLMDVYLKSVFNEMFLKKKFPEEELGKVTEIISGSTPSTIIKEYWDGEINWVTPAELINGPNYYYYETKKKITKEGLKSCSSNLFPKETVMLTTRAPIGKVAIAGNEMCSNQGFKNFITSEKINSVYLYFWFLLKKDYLNSLGHGATFKEISKKIVSKIKIPIPPISLQKKFAQIVEKVEKIKEAQKESKQEINDLFNALMQKAFQGELV